MSEFNPTPGAQPSPPAQTGRYPAAQISFALPDKIARWRIIGNIILAIPHLVLVYAIGIVTEILVVVAWFVGVITGKIPAGIVNFAALFARYQARLTLYISFLTEEYPPFSFASTATDPGDYRSMRVDLAPNFGRRSRVSIFFRMILAIPHFIALAVMGLIGYFVYLVAWLAVLITGSWPGGLRNYALGLLRWSTRVNAYLLLLTDDYPPFGFEA